MSKKKNKKMPKPFIPNVEGDPQRDLIYEDLRHEIPYAYGKDVGYEVRKQSRLRVDYLLDMLVEIQHCDDQAEVDHLTSEYVNE